ncbi:SDR family NAD(P)-dependent oxidoreductase [Peribacillus butanolivorans]|uniref:SDR family NAD(P)-dependent oxidoreductase n=1 Tax=Peribacillus butanolivorans TaxID=421767 RepID=UPI003D2D0553
MTHNPNGKIALVIGGSRGIGRHISATLADSGATVIVNYANNQEAAQQTVDFILSTGGKALLVKGDVTDEESVKHLVKQSEEKVGGNIGILINNATGPQPELSDDLPYPMPANTKPIEM